MTEPLSPEIRHYLAKEYPSNHNYRVFAGRVWPSRQLKRRLRRISALYPEPLESLLDLSVCKGYFAIHAALTPARPRVLGIDVNETCVTATRAVSAHLELTNVRAELLRLHELADRIDEFGGGFQTAIMINMYQYLYFGGITEADFYATHEEIFRMLRVVCTDTLVFSNCVDFSRLPPWVRETAEKQGRADGYSEAQIRAAAETCFRVEEHGMLGRRPIWKLTAI